MSHPVVLIVEQAKIHLEHARELAVSEARADPHDLQWLRIANGLCVLREMADGIARLAGEVGGVPVGESRQ